MRLRLAAVLTLLLPLVAACDREATTAKWRERQMAADPPALWSVEVLGSNARPVQICADSLVLNGLAAPLPDAPDAYCVRRDRAPEAVASHASVCQLGSIEYKVAVTVTGDTASAFDAAMRATTPRRPGEAVEQTRRFKRLGACPEGWAIGDRTDQTGALVKARPQ